MFHYDRRFPQIQFHIVWFVCGTYIYRQHFGGDVKLCRHAIYGSLSLNETIQVDVIHLNNAAYQIKWDVVQPHICLEGILILLRW